MIDDETMAKVYEGPYAEEHRAQNLADFLRGHELAPMVLTGDEGDLDLVVLVPERQHRRATTLTEQFFFDYDYSIAKLVEQDSKKSGVGFWAIGWVPLLGVILCLLGAYNEYQLGRDTALMVGQLVAAGLCIAAFLWLRRVFKPRAV